MSGFEICGVVLGVIPLVISALEHYKAGKGVAATFVKWRGHLDTLIFRLKLQNTFFYLQIRELLREAQVAQLEGQIDLTEEQCMAVFRDKQTGEEIREYLGPLYDTFMEVLGRYELCLKTIVAKIGLKTQQEYLAKEPSHDARKLAASFSKVQQTASTLFSAICQLPTQRVRAKVRKKADEPTTFSLFMGLEHSLQEISVNAYEADPSEESPATAK
ncbi:hypothetical protein SLS64_010098 [Diaporthe eres]